MAKVRLGKATFVERGYGQVEPNHMSAQRTGQIYAQLPVAADIDMLENGQFVTYNYADGVVDFNGNGEWMLVFNEVKVYRDGQSDCDFAMLRDNYKARVYSPIDGEQLEQQTQPRFYGGVDERGNAIPKVTAPADPWEMDSTENPFAAQWDYKRKKMMPADTTMVPRVFKTNIGDIYTTNCIMEDLEAEASDLMGKTFTPSTSGDDAGYLVEGEGADALHPTFEVVKVYDLGDRQRAVKLMRIK